MRESTLPMPRSQRAFKHGHTAGRKRTPEYWSWVAMMTRCRNPSFHSYPVYGGRGIFVCERWNDFAAFFLDMGPRPSPSHTLDRFPDKHGNYEPGNCRWATKSEQARNRVTSRPVVRSDGLQFPSIIDAAEATGGNRRCIRDVIVGRQKSHHGFSWRYAE